MVELLLNAGAEMNKQDIVGYTPLHEAIAANRKFHLLKNLVPLKERNRSWKVAKYNLS